MGAYVIKRIISAFGVLLFDALIVFLLIHLTPGDPAMMMVGGEGLGDISNLQAVRHSLGIDLPLHMQVITYFQGLFRGDMG